MAQKGRLTVREAGRKGGQSTSRRYGPEFYETIGRKGGRIGGPKGGQTTKKKYGHEFYEEIGHKGGQKVRDLIRRGKQSL